jgi:hypothetical protein
MADTKISALTAATTPLAGTEVLPIVQGGITKQVSVANLTAGRPIGVSGMTVTSGASTADILLTDTGTVNGRVRVRSQSDTMVLISGGGVTTTLDASGNVKFDAGNLIQGTAAKGINFTANTGAAGMTSQLLNWYEEGTWTPNQGAGLTVVGTFGSSGTYTRVGRMIIVRGVVTGTTSVAVAASSLICTNLPYAAASGQSSTGGAVNDAVSASSTVLAVNATLYSVQAIAATPGIGFSVTYQV